MLDILNLLEKAANEKHPEYACVLFEHGNLIAGDSEMAACIPYENPKEMLINAKLLLRALKATKGGEVIYDVRHTEAGITNLLHLRKGKREVILDGKDTVTYAKIGALAYGVPSPTWIEVSPDFVEQIGKVSQAMSDDDSKMWAVATSLHGNKLMATDGLAFFFCRTETEGSAVFPKKLVSFVRDVAQHEVPTHYGIEKGSVSFKFESGLIVTSTRNVPREERQEALSNMIDTQFIEPHFEVSEELKESIEAAATFAEFVVEISSTGVSSSQEKADFSEEIETGMDATIGSVTFDKRKTEMLLKNIEKISYAKNYACGSKTTGVNCMISKRG